jgi:hypothetical protein
MGNRGELGKHSALSLVYTAVAGRLYRDNSRQPGAAKRRLWIYYDKSETKTLPERDSP